MRAVIMAGGKGTRLASVNDQIPKPMFPIMGKPILDYQIESLKKSGIEDITLIVGHQKEIIIDYFGDGSNKDVHISYITEDEPLGTGGALYFLKEAKDDFVLLFGDLILDIDFNRFMEYHKRKNGFVTLYGHPNSHPYDSDLIEVDAEMKVTRIFSKKIKRDYYYHNFVNAGLYCINPKALDIIAKPVKMDLEKEIIQFHVDNGNVFAYRSTEYVKDMGTPDRLNSVTRDINNGVVANRSLKQKQKAIFLDRDGTINRYVGFLRRIDDFALLPGAAEGIAAINSSNYLVIVTTNQPVIARGEVSFEELEEIHKKMETELGNKGAIVDDIYYCPHHPHKGYEGEVQELKIDCNCRKPKIGMIARAAEKYNINLGESWYIGDTTTDIQTGKNAGMKTVLVKTGEAGADRKFNVQADYTASDLLEAVQYILGHAT